MNAKMLVGVAVVAAMFGVACADVTADASKQAVAGDNNGARSPNDPPMYEEDDPGEQGEPACVPAAVPPAGRGWTTHVNGRFSFQTPDTWKVNFEFTGNTDPAEGKFFGETQVTFKIATGAGFFARVGERLGPADGTEEMKTFPSTIPPSSGTTCVVNENREGVYRCDPMDASQITCESNRGTTQIWWRFIYHGGRAFEAWCSGTTGVEDQEATCAKVLATVKVTD